MENLYEILEVSPNASKEVIDKAYKTLAKKYHPDLQTGDDKKIAEEKMKKINDAYSILSDSEKRAEYDEKLKQEEELKKQQEEEELIHKIENNITEDYTKKADVDISQYDTRQTQAHNTRNEADIAEEYRRREQKLTDQYNKILEETDKAYRKNYEDNLRRLRI